MSNSLFYQALLLGASAFFAACSSSEDIMTNDSPPEQKTWMVSVYAQGNGINGDMDLTRAIFYGGNNGHRFSFIWDDGDEVKVYKGSTKLGTLAPSVTGQESTILTGTLTGAIAVNDVLNLYLPERAYDYSDQDGTLGNLSLRHAYQQSSTTVNEAKASGNTLSLATTRMDHAQAYWWLRLTDTEGNRLHPTRIQIVAASGKMVKAKAIDGTTTYFTEADPMDITVAKSDDNGEYPGEAFIAIRNESGSADTYKFKVWVGETIYVGPSDRALTYGVTHGKMDNVKRQLIKTTAASTLTVDDIANRVFTGSAIVPDDAEIIVKDEETVLTQGTDYLFEITDNVNVGDATVTVTGQADKLARAQTKYIGTTTKTFRITKATPVIVMDAADMSLVNNLTENTSSRTITRVFIDNNGNGTWDEGTDYDITALATVTYSSSSEAVATVDALTGDVTAVGPGTCTITAQVVEADNWLTNAVVASYTVNVEQEVNGGNGVNPWDDKDGANEEGGKIYVE